MKRLIAIRSRYKAFGRGTFELLYPENRKVMAFIRTYEGEHILVVANLSRFVQAVELDLTAFKGATPVEIFGRTPFPTIGETPYFLSAGPHSFYWFTLQQQSSSLSTTTPRQLLTITVGDNWQDVYARAEVKKALEMLLPDYLQHCRWFDSRGRVIQTVYIQDAVPIELALPNRSSTPSSSTPPSPTASVAPNIYNLVLIRVEYTEGIQDMYMIPIAYAEGIDANSASNPYEEAAIVYLQGKNSLGILFDALVDKEFSDDFPRGDRPQTPLQRR